MLPAKLYTQLLSELAARKLLVLHLIEQLSSDFILSFSTFHASKLSPVSYHSTIFCTNLHAHMQNILKSRIKYVNKTFLWMWYVAQAWGQTRLVIISAYNSQEGTEWCNWPGPACSSCCLAPALSWSAVVACHGWWGHLQNVSIALHKTLTGWTDVCPIWLSSSMAGRLRYAEA